MKLFLFAASLRTASFNKKLIHLCDQFLKSTSHESSLKDFAAFSAPLYNQDIQDSTGIPDSITDFVKQMQASDGLIISSPEYNFSTPGTLKNLIDWVSRLDPMPWKNYPILLLSASPSLVGGNRGLWATRVPLEACGAYVFPTMFSLSSAHTAFDAENNLIDKNLEKRLHQQLIEFTNFVARIRQDNDKK